MREEIYDLSCVAYSTVYKATRGIVPSTQNATSSEQYGISVSFGPLAPIVTSESIKDGSVVFESVESVKDRYMKHVLKVFGEKGVSQQAIAEAVNVAKNTLTKAGKKK